MTEPPRRAPHTDAPTTDDELARRPFAELLAREIEVTPAGAGLVIGLVGPWGAGKTSVLKMMAESLNKTTEEAGGEPTTVVIEFNPWFFSGAGELLTGFFNTLTTAVPERLGETRAARVADSLKSYGSLLGKLRGIPVIGEFAGAGADVVAAAGDLIDDRPRTLQEHREKVAEALDEVGARIVVIVDDVDRLQPDEIRELMRMVKLVGDLPNLVYLLAFDRQHVAAALSASHPGVNGTEYLEKIIQIEHYLPEPPIDRLELMLDTDINRAIAAVPQERFDVNRWEQIRKRVLLPLVHGPRHIRRYTNALPLALDLASDEVDPVDVLALTALRVFLPDVHRQLPARADDLVPGFREATLWSRGDAEQEAAVRLRDLATVEADRPVVEAFIELVFPAAAGTALSATNEERADWSRRRRVAVRAVFSRYLTAALPEGALSMVEISDAIGQFVNPEELSEFLRARDPTQVSELLSRLHPHLDEVPAEAVEGALPVLLSQYDRLAAYENGPLSAARRLLSLIAAITLQVDDPTSRADIISRLFDDADRLSDRHRIVSVSRYKDDLDQTVIAEPTLGALNAKLAEQILAADPDVLVLEPDFGRLIAAAAEVTLPKAPDRFRERLADDRIFVRYLSLYLDIGRAERMYDLRWNELVDHLGEEWLVWRLGSVGEPALSDHEQDALDQARVAAAPQAPASGE